MPSAPRILVMEDDYDVAQLVQIYLQEEGYRVAVAQDGHTGLAQFFSSGADLVIVDLKMPRVDGWEVCAQLRAVSTLPIIILTAYAFAADRARGLSLGVDDYLCKPFNGAELLARVQAALSRRLRMPAHGWIASPAA